MVDIRNIKIFFADKDGPFTYISRVSANQNDAISHTPDDHSEGYILT